MIKEMLRKRIKELEIEIFGKTYALDLRVKMLGTNQKKTHYYQVNGLHINILKLKLSFLKSFTR